MNNSTYFSKYPVFAYIGGLCVFLSNFIKLVGHYILRVLFMIYEWCLQRCNKTSKVIEAHRHRVLQRKQLREHRRQLLTDSLSPSLSPREMQNPAGSPSHNQELDIEDGYVDVNDEFLDEEEDDGNDGNFLNASCG